jgi:hypothetical protein
MPEPGPLGDTLFDARDRAMVAASFVNSPLGGNVETVFTPATQFLLDRDLGRGVDSPRPFPAKEHLLASAATMLPAG